MIQESLRILLGHDLLQEIMGAHGRSLNSYTWHLKSKDRSYGLQLRVIEWENIEQPANLLTAHLI